MGLSVEWSAETAYVLTLYKYLLGILGLWVLDEENIFSRIRWFTSTIIELSTTISLSLEVIRHCRGYEDALDAFLSASSSVTSISKLLLHRVNWRHKLILVESIINDWTFVKTPYSRDIMLKYARIGKLGSSIFFYFGCASCIFLFSPLIFANFDLLWSSEEQIYNKTNERRLLLAAYCVFGSYTSFAYGFIEVLQTLQILVNCISQCGNDGFFFDLTMHVCGQFEVLRVDFSEIDNKEFLSRNRLGILLKRHHRLIYLAHHLQKAFSLVILSQLLMSVILLCVEGFQLILTLSMQNTYAVTKHVLFIVVLLMQLFLYCFAGQTLEFQSQGLASAIYDSLWYNFDVSVMKNLPLIILRAAKPHQLTAGKFLAINFMSFKEILKASASYLSVLRISGNAIAYLLSVKTWTSVISVICIYIIIIVIICKHCISLGMKTNWNSGMDYGFSVIRRMMWIVGVWPLQHDDMVCTFRWFIIFIVESLTLISILIEPFKSCGDTKDALEVFLIIYTGFHSWINVVFARIYMKKIAINVTSAIDDWSSSSTEKQSYLIMTGYARIGRVVAVFHLMIGLIAAIVYFSAIIVGNKQQVVIIDNDTVTLWNFVLPSTCLFRGISYSTYKALFLMQILQAFILYVAECASDIFFFTITMHLCGQLELLRIRFVELVGRKTNERNHYRRILGSCIKRHYKLITLAKNIEEAFNLNILIHLSIITIVIAVSGMHIIMSVKHYDYINVVKSMSFVNFSIVQSFLFTHAGETLQKQSESIVSAIYSTTWHELPSTIVKDLIFIMMRTKIPLQLTAGKFFYITRSTTTDILKTALTYISFLQVTMEE